MPQIGIFSTYILIFKVNYILCNIKLIIFMFRIN